MTSQHLVLSIARCAFRSLAVIPALLVAALAVAKPAHAGAIPVPNGGFETIVKPGTGGTVTGVLHLISLPTNYTFANGIGSGVVLANGSGAPTDSQAIAWSDSTFSALGSTVDTPGWVKDNSGTAVIQRVYAQSGLNGFAINGSGGGFGGNTGGTTISSAASLGTIARNQDYILQVAAGAVLNGSPAASTIVLQLLANGLALTPTSTSMPALTSSFQTFSETFSGASLAGLVGESLTIRLGTPSGSTGKQTDFDNVTLAAVPEPSAAVLLLVGATALVGVGGRRAFGQRRPVVALRDATSDC